MSYSVCVIHRQAALPVTPHQNVSHREAQRHVENRSMMNVGPCGLVDERLAALQFVDEIQAVVAPLVEDLPETRFSAQIVDTAKVLIELLARAVGQLINCGKDWLDVAFLEPGKIRV